jgi:hypothetical protein
MISRGQATLEFSLIFIIMVALLFGLLGLWKWSSDNIIKRQLRYNETRIQAGSRTSPGEPGKPFTAEDIQENQLYLFK